MRRFDIEDKMHKQGTGEQHKHQDGKDEKGQCCLFLAGNVGNGEKGRTCFVKTHKVFLPTKFTSEWAKRAKFSVSVIEAVNNANNNANNNAGTDTDFTQLAEEACKQVSWQAANQGSGTCTAPVRKDTTIWTDRDYAFTSAPTNMLGGVWSYVSSGMDSKGPPCKPSDKARGDGKDMPEYQGGFHGTLKPDYVVGISCLPTAKRVVAFAPNSGQIDVALGRFD